jgi:hypothetical protein
MKERKFSIIGSGVVGNFLYHQSNSNVYSRDTVSDMHNYPHDIIVVAAPTGNRLHVKDNQDQDLKNCDALIDTLSHCRYEALLHISTVDVYDNHISDSALPMNICPIHAYGHSRWYLEKNLQQLPKCHTIRLPSLIDSSVKKNLLFDLQNMIWLEKINLQNQMQWYPLIRLKQDILDVIEKSLPFENFTSCPISNIDIVKRYQPKLLSLLSKNQFEKHVRYNVKSSQSDYLVAEEEIWAAFDRYFDSD